MSGAFGQLAFGLGGFGAPSTAPSAQITYLSTIGTQAAPAATTSTVTTFAPTTLKIFSFQATFDGAQYDVLIPWNVSRQGWYYNILDQANNLVVASALVGSPPTPQRGVNLVGGYFKTSSLYYYAASQQFIVMP